MGCVITTTVAVGVGLGSGNWFNSPQVSLPAGIFLFFIAYNFVPNTGTSITYSSIRYVINTQINNSGTSYFDLSDTRSRIIAVFGVGDSYGSLQMSGVLTLNSAQTLYASAQINYTGGPGTTNGGTIIYVRIG